MDEYTIFCTTEQTRKAFELGAPIYYELECHINLETLEREPYPDVKVNEDGEPILKTPTAEQMIGWLEEQIDNINLIKITNGKWLYMFYPTNSSSHETKSGYPTRKEATLAAINAALEYLSNEKIKH